MEILTFEAGPLATNAYLARDEEAHAALVVDAPPEVAADLLDAVRRAGDAVALIVLTHAHWDHIVDTAELKATLEAPVAAHPASRSQLEQPATSIVAVPYRIEPIVPDRWLEEGDVVEVGRYRFQVLHTPGHAPGQISLYEPEARVLFGGDTLFPGGFGRVDLPGASAEETLATLRRLLDLPDGVVVYPGHGRPTTIGAERPWMERLVAAGPQALL